MYEWRRNSRPVSIKRLLYFVYLFLLCPAVTLSAVGQPTPTVNRLAATPADLIGTYFFYDRRDHGYAFHLQLEADGTAFYIEQAEDGNLVRKGSWSASGDKITVKLPKETKVLNKDDYGQLIESRDGETRIFSNIRRTTQP